MRPPFYKTKFKKKLQRTFFADMKFLVDDLTLEPRKILFGKTTFGEEGKC